MRIIWQNTAATDATLSTFRGTEVVQYPLANAVNGRLHPECRIEPDGNGHSYLQIEFSPAITANGILVAGYKINNPGLSSNETLAHAWSGVDLRVYSANYSNGYLYSFFSPAVTAKWWFVGDAAVTSGTYARFGEVWIVNNAELPHNCTMSSAVDQRTGEVSEIITGGGNIWSYPQWKGRIFNLTWELLTESELQTFIDLHEACYPNGTFWLDVGIDSTSPDLLFCYYRNKSLDITPQGPGLYSVNLEIQEVPEPNYYA